MLTDAQLDQFRSTGYLVIPNVIPPATLARVKQEYSARLDQLFEGWAAEGRVQDAPNLSFWDKLSLSYKAGCDWFQPLDISLPGDQIKPDTPMHFGPAIFDLVTHTALLDLIEALLGPEITLNPIQHVRIKPPAPQLAKDEIRAHVSSTDWHQDRGVGLQAADETQMITAWVAITDATVENGCLQVIPGIAKGLLPHCPRKQTCIAPDQINTDEAVPLPVPAGGVVLFHPLVAHASLTNHSEQFRWSFDLRFNVTGQNTGREHFPSFIARSRVAPENALSDWRVWKQGWETARLHLSSQPHIPIHRWDASSPVCA